MANVTNNTDGGASMGLILGIIVAALLVFLVLFSSGILTGDRAGTDIKIETPKISNTCHKRIEKYQEKELRVAVPFLFVFCVRELWGFQ